MKSINNLFIAYLLILIGTIITYGFYSLGGVIILLATLIILLFNRRGIKTSVFIIERNVPKIILVVTVALSLMFYGGMYQSNIFHLKKISTVLLIISFLISLSYLVNKNILPSIFQKHRFKIMVLIFLLTNIFMIFSSPDPKIDVFRSLKYGTSTLTTLKNPYNEIYPPLYESKILNYFSYLPSTLIYFLPFNILFGDPRFGIIFAEIIVLGLLFKLFNQYTFQKEIKEIFLLIFLYYPLFSFITEQSFVDILIILGVSIILFLIFSKPRKSKIIFYLGLVFLMDIKQVMFFLTPTFAFRGRLIKNIKQLLIIVLLASFGILPFFLWSWKDFIYDNLLIYFLPPQGVSYNASLNIRSALVNFFGLNINPNLFLIINFIYFLIIMKIDQNDKASFFRLMSYFFLGFFLLGSFAYINHYFLVCKLLLIYIYSLLLNKNHRRPTELS